MRIETKNLILREHLERDWKDIHEYASIPEFSQYDFWGPNTEQDSKDFVQRMMEQSQAKDRYKFDLAIFHKGENHVIGGVGVRRCAQESLVCDLGYAIHPRYQRQGLATEAVLAMLSFAFNELRVVLVYATCDCENIASYRVMEKCGMRRVGLLARHKEFKGAWHDSYRYEIVNPNS